MTPQEIQIGETRIKNWPDGVSLPKGARIIQPEQPAVSKEQPQRKTEAEPTAQAGVARHEPAAEQKPTTAPAAKAGESRETESRQQPAPAALESAAGGGAAGAGGGGGHEGGLVSPITTPEPAARPPASLERTPFQTGVAYLTKGEAIRLYLERPTEYYKLTPKQRAEVCRVAEVESAEIETPVPIKFIFGQMREIYERVLEGRKKQGKTLIEMSTNKLENDDERVALIYHALLNAIYRREAVSFPDGTTLRKCINLIEGEDTKAAVTQWYDSIFWFLDYWRKEFTGIGGAQKDQVRAEGGAHGKMANYYLDTLWMDPEIEKATHAASTRYFDELAYESGVIKTATVSPISPSDTLYQGIYQQVRNENPQGSEDRIRQITVTRYIKELGEEGKVKLDTLLLTQKEGKRVARKVHDVAVDILGEMLDKVTLKVRNDSVESTKFTYSAYKTDQLGLQLAEGKYDYRAFERIIARDPNDHPFLLWNNGMETLFTFPNSRDEIKNWIDQLREWKKALPKVDPNKAVGLMRNMAWLISYAQGVDDRIIDFRDYKKITDDADYKRVTEYEALDFENLFKLDPDNKQRFELDPVKQRKVLEAHLDNFFRLRDSEEPINQAIAERIITRNVSRARTKWEIRSSVRGAARVPSYDGYPELEGKIAVLETGIDLDAVWFNPETNRWQYVLNFRKFFSREKGSFFGDEVLPLNEVERDKQGNVISLPPKIVAEAGKELTVDLSNLWVYEGYKQYAYQKLAEILMAASSSSFAKRMEHLDDLLEEDTWKQIYAIPEYGANVTSHLIDRVTMEERSAALFKDRYRGLKPKYLELVLENRLWLDWGLNHQIHFVDCNVDGSWMEAQRLSGINPGKKVRQAMMELPQIDVWEHFARKNGIDLETLFLFAGVRKIDDEEIKDYQLVDFRGREFSYKNRYFILDYLNAREIDRPDKKGKIFIPDRINDSPDKSTWRVELVKKLTENPELVGKLIKLGKRISRYEDGEWSETLASSIKKENPQLARSLRENNRQITPEQDANWLYLNPFEVQRLVEHLNWEYEEDIEMKKPENWFETGAKTKMVDMDMARLRVNMRQRRMVIPLGLNRGQYLYHQWFDEVGKNIDSEGKDLYGSMKEGYEENRWWNGIYPELSIRRHYGLSFTRGLNAGWWEFHPETGLIETSPWYDERALVYRTAAIFTAPFRMKLARIKAEADYKTWLLGEGRLTTEKKEAYRLTANDKNSGKYQEIYDQHLEEQLPAAGGPDLWQYVFTLARNVVSADKPGKGFIDEEPAGVYARSLGAWDREKVNKYRSYCLYHLNLNPRGITPDPNEPDQIREAVQHLKERASQTMDQLKKTLLLPEAFEAMAFAGISLEELHQLGDTQVDDTRQWGYGLASAPAPGIGLWIATHLSPVAAANFYWLLPLTILGSIYTFAFGVRLGTDVSKDSLVKEPVIRLGPITIGKLSHRTIFRLQQSLPYIRGISPISKQREREKNNGRGHTHYLSSEGIVGYWEEWQKAFGPA